jgi:hypothetical protein
MKLAGKLAWGVTKLFKHFGRAMLRPIFDQQSKRCGIIDFELERCLRWWIGILENQIAECRLWAQPKTETLHIFCDARGTPPHLGAVLLSQSQCLWTHCETSEKVVQHFRSRKDAQIMGLELLSIVLGVHTFAAYITGTRVIIHSDNRGSELAVRRGSARTWDHAQIVHKIWEDLLTLRVCVYIKRVRTDDNIADLPSRESFRIFEHVGAIECAPVLPQVYNEASTWEVLHERWAVHGR